MTKKALLVSIYRAADQLDCSNHGVTSQNQYAWLLHSGGPHTPDDRYPILEVDTRPHLKGGIRALPKHIFDKTIVMFGGNFIYSSDSRFRDINPYPIPVHDRIE